MGAVDPTTHVVPRDRGSFVLDPSAEPALRVTAGAHVWVETEEANPGTFTSAADRFQTMRELHAKAGGVCPVTGPIHLEGARAGDCLLVSIEAIECGDERQVGYTTTMPTTMSDGAGGEAAMPAHTKICSYDGEDVLVPLADRVVRIPRRPFVGTIATAPARDGVLAATQGRDFCGNIDCAGVAPGATVVLPINVDGGLLYLGDVHAAQGDGELTSCAIETRARVGIRLDHGTRDEVGMVAWPQLNTATTIGSIACPGTGSVGDSIRLAFTDLVNRVERHFRMRRVDAFQLLGQVATVRIGQALEPLVACVVEVERQYVE